jgi:hypothetical protein
VARHGVETQSDLFKFSLGLSRNCKNRPAQKFFIFGALLVLVLKLIRKNFWKKIMSHFPKLSLFEEN